MSLQTETPLVGERVDDGVGWLSLDRPPVNVLNIALLEQLEAALDRLAHRDDLRVLVLRAEGKLFSAGVDVGDHTPARVGTMLPLFDRVCRALADFPVPTLAAVQGHALGGGCELVLCCDLAVAAAGARLGQPEIKLAAIAPVAALRLAQLAGRRVAADLLFGGEPLDAAAAREAGLLNAVVAPEELDGWVARKAAQLAGLSAVALRHTKRALAAGTGDWAAALPALERLYLDELMASADAREGLAAFLDKRAAVWTHR